MEDGLVFFVSRLEDVLVIIKIVVLLCWLRVDFIGGCCYCYYFPLIIHQCLNRVTALYSPQNASFLQLIISIFFSIFLSAFWVLTVDNLGFNRPKQFSYLILILLPKDFGLCCLSKTLWPFYGLFCNVVSGYLDACIFWYILSKHTKIALYLTKEN